MNTRTRTIASFFSVAMAAMLFGAVVTHQIQRPTAAQARNLDPLIRVTIRPFALRTDDLQMMPDGIFDTSLFQTQVYLRGL